MQTSVESVSLGGSVPDFTLWGMFTSADLLVQLVMLMLVAASVWSWAIIFEKARRMRRVNAAADVFEEGFWSGNSLETLYKENKDNNSHPMARIFVAAMREWQRSTGKAGAVLDRLGLEDRLARVNRVTTNREMDKIEHGLGFLATVGSTAPFIGLFGTVWGIMNSFQAIALSSNTSLAVVAPGIAEALLATGLGLVAAIPAVMGYNKLSHEMTRYAGRLEGFSDEFYAILSREMDRKKS
ncbi:MAG: protein TolQ [Sphingomonadales bacterium]|nr:protein TolQ [Sphingomonadales bacterium]